MGGEGEKEALSTHARDVQSKVPDRHGMYC